MKRTKFYLLVLVVAGCFITSCEIIKDLADIKFTTDYEEITITINPSKAGPYVFHESYLKADLEAEIKEHGGSLDNLKNAKVEEISVEVTEGETDLSAFDYVKVYVSTPNFSQVLIGSAQNILDDIVAVDLDATGEELKDILKEEQYKITVSGALDKDIPEVTSLLLKIKYSVVVGP